MNWYRKYDPIARYYVKVEDRYASNTVRDGSYLTDCRTYASIYTYEDALRLLTLYNGSYLERADEHD